MEMIESEIHQLFVKLLDGKHKILNFDTPSISVSILKRRIEALTSVPFHHQLLRFSDSRILHDRETLKIAESRETTEIPEALELNTNGLPRNQLVCSGTAGFQSRLDREVGKFPVVVHLSLRLRGGKGGFGSLLRGAATKAGLKKTNNFDACRDMSGRRLRHVNAEKKLEEWRAAADERKLERMAEEYIKKKTKEVAKNAKSKGGDSAEKYVAKYREESSRCMEEVERSVRESMMNGLKRKSGKKETENHAKRLKIWFGKRKMGDSDSEDMDEEEIDGDKRVEDAKSVITDNGNLSDSSKEAEEAPCSITCKKVISGSLDEGYQEEDVSARESPKTDNSIDGCVDDGKCISRNKPAVESLEEIMDHDGANIEVPHKFDSSKLKEMVSQLPGVSVPEEIVTSAAEVSGITRSEPLEEVSVSVSAEVQDLDKPLNFDEYNSAAGLEVLGMERLKAELQTRGLKCGGTLQERATRLFLLKTTPLDMLPKDVLGYNFGAVKSKERAAFQENKIIRRWNILLNKCNPEMDRVLAATDALEWGKKSLMKEAEKADKRGVCYLSRVPPHMDPLKLRHILSEYGEIQRIYLTPEDPAAQVRKKSGGFRGQEFSEGWVEFIEKGTAKRVANMLNGEQIGGRKKVILLL